MSASFLKWGSINSFSSTYCTCQYDCLSWFGGSIQYLMWWHLLLFRKLHCLIYFVMLSIIFGLTSYVDLAVDDATIICLRRFLIISLIS